jgi:YegS/Rv2252/BmrU family lipid kinase
MNMGTAGARGGADGARVARVLMVFNPTAGRRSLRRLHRAVAALRRAGATVRLQATAARGDAERLAREAAAGQQGPVDLLAIAGGDGTINEAVNGLAAAAGGKAPLPLALLPLGTANVLAREIGQRLSPAAAAEAMLRGRPHPVHLGQANGRRFAIMAGAGFDAHVVANVSARLKRRLGRLAYVWEALRQLFLFPYPAYRVTIDGEVFHVASVVIAKGRLYAGPYVAAPDARLDRPDFQVCLFQRGGRWNAIRYALALTLGVLPRLKGYRIVTGRHLRIDGPPGDPLQGDGDIIAHLPAEISIAPGALALMLLPQRAD